MLKPNKKVKGLTIRIIYTPIAVICDHDIVEVIVHGINHKFSSEKFTRFLENSSMVIIVISIPYIF